MPDRKHASQYATITEKRFFWQVKDMEELRNACSRIRQKIQKFTLIKYNKKQLVNALLANEFGEEAVMEYYEQCSEWDRMKDFVEGNA